MSTNAHGALLSTFRPFGSQSRREEATQVQQVRGGMEGRWKPRNGRLGDVPNSDADPVCQFTYAVFFGFLLTVDHKEGRITNYTSNGTERYVRISPSEEFR
jgi:hypothetical protein